MTNRPQAEIPCVQGNKLGNSEILTAILGMNNKKPLSIITGNYVCRAENFYCQTGKPWVLCFAAGIKVSQCTKGAVIARLPNLGAVLIFQNMLEHPAPLTLFNWFNSDLGPVDPD